MTNYQRGYEIERKIMNNHRRLGDISFRSAGSHSPFDVVCISASRVSLIQVKRVKKYRAGMFNKDIKDLEKIKCPPNCFKELHVWEDNHDWVLLKVI